MTRLMIGFANLGRAPSASRVRTAMRTIERVGRSVPGFSLGLVEIDEGDRTKPTDHELVAAVFKAPAWRRQWAGTKEPILATGWLRLDRKAGQRINVGLSVKHWLPTRHLNMVVYPFPNGTRLAHINTHYPITPKQHKGWVARIRSAMVGAYRRQQRKERRLVRRLINAGYHVAITADRNRRNYVPLHQREHVVARRGVDVISVIPARGYIVASPVSKHHALPIEKFHQLITAEFTLRKRGGAQAK